MTQALSVLCGQLLVVGLEGPSLGEAERASFAAGLRGGYVLFRRNVAADDPRGLFAVAELSREVRGAASHGPPPLVAVDQEGGRVMRLGAPALRLPPMRHLGDLDDDDLVRRVAAAQARELAALGFTMSFAPVADVHTRDDNPIIGDRAFATDAARVARLAGAFADGLADGGILSCAKHFPGHGDTTVDSHLALPRVDRARDALERVEIAAFRALARRPSLASMMTAHVVYDAIDASQPATLSRAACVTLLREELGFEGVLFSDDLEMKAIQIPAGEAAVRAIAAGCDVLLVCSRADLADEAHAALVREAEASPAFRARCEEAFARAAAMRERVVPTPAPDAAALARAFEASRPLADELAQRLAEGSRGASTPAGSAESAGSAGSESMSSGGPTAHVSRRVVTCDAARANADDVLGVIDDGCVIIEGGDVRWVGPRAEAPAGVAIVDHGDRVITPGLVDAHTHAAWVGSRHDEYALRLAGADYRAIAAAGGGIVASQRAVAAATEAEIASTLRARLGRMAALGVTTVEVKSGYGLEPDEERKQLRAIASVRAEARGPDVVPTFLALHALPPSAREARAAYVERVVSELVPEVARANLAEFVDAYVDQNAFTVAEARLLCEAAAREGLGIRLHVGQFADVGGGALAADVGARSVDHLENVSDDDIAALARAGTAAVLLPIASFTLGQAPPPVAKLRAAGVPLVVASDANPGTAPSESLPLAMALAVRQYGLTVAEALLGATRLAAASLDRAGVRRVRGVLTEGARADLVVWDLPHEAAIVQPWGAPRTHLVLRGGAAISAAT